MGAWNWLDWVFAAIEGGSVIAGAIRGITQELISLASLVIGLVVAAVAYPRAALWFEDLTKSHDVALGLGFLTLFLGVLLMGAVISVLARKLIKTAGLIWFDRFLGAVFGSVRGLVVDCILLLVLLAFAIKPGAVQRSILAPYVTVGANIISLAMPANLKAQFRLGFERFRETLSQNDKKATKN
ncbi:MAG TPA: CvpA family protein [Terriglobia bacterium]|nr:CvpA family protein [Terriglobia bacterium]